MSIIRNFKAKKGRIYRGYVILDEFFTKADYHHVYMLASGIAFNILLYLIPLVLVVIYIVSTIYDVHELAASLEKILKDMLPPTAETRAMLSKIVEEINLITKHSSVFGWIGFFALLWVSSTLISSLRTSLNRIFNISSPAIFVFYRIKDIALTIVLTFIILIYSYALPLVSFILSIFRSILPDFASSFITKLILIAFSLLSSFALFYFIFRMVPNKKLPRYVRLVSTGLSVVFIEISRNLFGWYVGSVANYGKFYGAYAVVASVAIWIYYSALILLFSAEVAMFSYEKLMPKLDNKK